MGGVLGSLGSAAYDPQCLMATSGKSSRLHILNSEPLGYSESARAILRDLGELDERELDRSELLVAIGEVDVLLVRLAHSLDREVFDASDRLAVVVSPTTGLDHIDLEYASARGVAVLSLKGEYEFLSSVTSTAEHTWALLLALARRLPDALEHVRTGGWDRDSFRGTELQGKRIGIVGLGRIGVMVAEYARAFRMDALGYDPAPRSWPDGVVRVDSLLELAGAVDVLTIHVPLEEATRGLIGSDVLGRLPAGAFLVNTSRSEIVDSTALLATLEDGRLGGAALDVVPSERAEDRRQESGLIAFSREHDNLIITPHIGGATKEAMERTEVFMAEKLRRHLDGGGE